MATALAAPRSKSSYVDSFHWRVPWAEAWAAISRRRAEQIVLIMCAIKTNGAIQQERLFDGETKYLGPVEGIADRNRRFMDRRFAVDHHFLCGPHAFHDIHDGKRHGGHDFILHGGLRVGFEQRDVEVVVAVLFV